MLSADYTLQFQRAVKRLKEKHVDLTPLLALINLVIEDTDEAKEELTRKHNMHDLKGSWAGSTECHIENMGDWFLIWKTGNGLAVFQRTGSHDELFR